ncbi:MAG TPA: prepilin peptidase [Allosphingosinicella sp.]|jgi:leader peptidase (prepilin peptidase)/N-methyltransferase
MSGGDPNFLYTGLGLTFGAIVGSFLATLLIRWPQGKSVVAGRSRCDSCGAPLGLRDLVPLLSYAALKGKCRRCGGRIDQRHFAVELGAASLGVIALIAHPVPLAVVTMLLGLWLLLLAALDVEHQWLPDLLTLPLLVAGLVAAWAGFGPALGERVTGAALGWALLELLRFGYRRLRGREGLGGGDPKLFGAIGGWVGAMQLPLILVGAGVLGLTAALLMRLRGREVTRTTRLPLGALMAVTAWPVWLVVAA